MARKTKKQKPTAAAGDITVSLPHLIESAKALLANSEAELDYLLALAKQRGVKVSERQLREIDALREMIKRGPPLPP